MLDAAACANLALGAPHVYLEALNGLHRGLLVQRGLRRSSLGVHTDEALDEDKHPFSGDADSSSKVAMPSHLMAATPASEGICS
jgi:hypothetical protein